jgi:uncharacterized protein YerC
MKVKAKDLPEKYRVTILDALYTAAGTVRGRDAMKLFLRDLLTESERIMLGRRILIARHLLEDKTYDEISTMLGVGHDTIWRVDRWLNDQLPGYENAVRDMEKQFAHRRRKRLDRKMYATSALYRLKKKYPAHFLLFPWPRSSKNS